MSNTSEAFERSVALEKALKLYENASPPHPDTVIEAAEKFHAFLSGAPKEAAPEAPSLPVLKVPHFSDEYLYFQFLDTPILYRSHLGHQSMAPDGVSRLHAKYDTEWRPAASDKDTRAKLRNLDEYHEINASRAAQIIRKYVTGVRFE